MVSILAFDSNSIRSLLSEKFEEFFNSEYPIFYKNKHLYRCRKGGKSTIMFRYNTPIDVAIENNQIRGVGMMINHIVKYQNNYVSSYLF